MGVIQLNITVGSVTRPTIFMVIKGKPIYNLLVGRGWLHGAAPSSMHQPLIIWRGDGIVKNIEADQSYFMADVNNIGQKQFDMKLANIAPCQPAEDNLRHQAGVTQIMMSELEALKRISAYIAENKINSALEAETNIADEANKIQTTESGSTIKAKVSRGDSLEAADNQLSDCIYNDEPLGFKKDPLAPEKMQQQDPLEEIDLGEEGDKRPTFISANIDQRLRSEVTLLLREFKDCFAWDYNEMPGLSKELVELRLPIQARKKPVKQTPRCFAPAVMSKIKEEVERLLKSKFIRISRYVEWLANIVPIMKKNGKLRVCIDFRDLNAANPKDEYAMPVAEMLIDSDAGFEYLSMLDGYTSYNQIFIAEENMPKTAFRCPGALGTYEWGYAIQPEECRSHIPKGNELYVS
ncbi:uncharacterized protein LOC131604695 [Vicia villosa]|uniref:uncharacterized protein LOC131604695 n=1 Tax=Vicia villosa TaxID=3911 RepID=UPI00273CAF72|nr:uncharacterized protein LOC131604695 [Vicia villosa]